MARTLGDDEVATLAAAHEHARVTATPIDPVSRRHPEVTLEDAYAIQAAWVDLQVAAGAEVRGKKIGLTSRAMQQAMRIDEPDFGILLDHMFIPNGGSFAASEHLDPKLEVELAFVLRETIDSDDPSPDDVYDATDHVVAALELIDARSHRVHPVDGVTRTVRDTISDNAANSGIVVGDVRLDAADARGGRLRWAGAICTRNGTVEETGVAAGVLGDPVLGVVWLARRLHGLGIPLMAGETILAGSFTRPVDCRAGDHFEVDFGTPGLDLGTITVDVT
ncbi:MAG: 2-oxo-hepta-3-ene-1,7-dioic acid hydratase [Actinomycetota bacterium]